MQLWRSLQFCLYTALVAVGVLLFIQIVVGLQTSVNLNRVQRTLEAISQERTSAYRLASLAHPVLAAETPQDAEMATNLSSEKQRR